MASSAKPGIVITADDFTGCCLILDQVSASDFHERVAFCSDSSSSSSFIVPVVGIELAAAHLVRRVFRIRIASVWPANVTLNYLIVRRRVFTW
jgi:hypothetical protein